jgi:hypothetical protein
MREITKKGLGFDINKRLKKNLGICNEVVQKTRETGDHKTFKKKIKRLKKLLHTRITTRQKHIWLF